MIERIAINVPYANWLLVGFLGFGTLAFGAFTLWAIKGMFK